ncbi:asparagine synthase (glutamine-hydrolyzing) [Haladaptatus sp. DYSN1]|uniref:asparagine synthase (glutamine-hydrolyzing) n=1 Tax=unclassified Haladaptatus TaxID=2622732 RepID=UPI002406BF39|nr:asparagine synthase (glutamine-hydrolyzing) [Haladaptatus sp. DYSN1]
MCGIAGLFTPTGPRESVLKRMNECLVHRGPDDTGIHIDGPVGLAHRRLSIIDPEAGSQPIFNEDRTISIVFNGEIYNYKALRDSLSGHDFETNTDTEVLVHLYEEHGPSFVQYLEGMFAFALWDSGAEKLFLARDPMGIKPLVYATDGTWLSFASELSALYESGVTLGGLDEAALKQYLVFGFVPTPKTAFENAWKIPPGTMISVSESGLDHWQFYRPSIVTNDLGFQEAASELRDRIETAVERRLMSDVPLGAFLSGGIDSSIIVGVMADMLSEPVKTFTVGFEESVFDESWAAQEVAEYHNTDHHTYTVTPDDVRSLIPSVLDRLGEPFADPSLLPTYVVARETSQEVTVALSGDGADELFAGYEKYRGEYVSGYYRALPASIRTNVIEPVVHSLPTRRNSKLGEATRKVEKFLRAGEPDLINRHLGWLRHPDGIALETIGNDAIERSRGRLVEAHEEVDSWYDATEFQRMLAVDTRFVLPNQMLRKVDQATMYNSLEARVPFLDTAVVEFALSLPQSYKITPRTRKRVLRHAFSDVLPQKIEKRGKQGFDMPIGEWFRGPMAQEFRITICDDPTDLLEIADILSVFEEHRNGSHDHEKFLWNVYVYARWAKRMADRGLIET